MKLLNKLTLSSLRLNRKRTIATIVGILLSTALLCTVATMTVSIYNAAILEEKYASGDYHYAFYERSEEAANAIAANRQVESTYQTAAVGYATLEGSANEDKPYVYLLAMDENGYENSSAHLTEGRFPENDSEIVISSTIKTNGGVDINVGDTITLNVGTRVSASDTSVVLGQSYPYTGEQEQLIEGYTKEYTVVGITERLNSETEPYSAPGYTVLTYWSEKKTVCNTQER